ncbi:MAG: universal stress protein [Deltaproteobacteria bacterium]|nr:universal stress protein [Deltaproteobacteria bacterium]MBW2661054.1 universal stress protein [Deltaproteobacteria bacterium]
MAIKKIACCTDFSDNAETAFVTALDMAEKYRAKLFVIHVLPPVINPVSTDIEWALPDVPEHKSLMLSLEERMQQDYGSRLKKGIDCDLIVLSGHVSSEIIAFLKDNSVDLVVVGSYGMSGMGLVVFGSVSRRVAHKAPCSVMIVRNV